MDTGGDEEEGGRKQGEADGREEGRQVEGKTEGRKKGRTDGQISGEKKKSSLPELNCRFATGESEVRERGQALHNKAGFKYKMAIMG